MTALSKIEGIGAAYAEKLNTAGVGSIEALLKSGATAKGRKDLVASTGINDALILRWVNHADLFRVSGIGEEYSDLLEIAGVDTVAELAQRKAENLFKKMEEVNAEKNIVRKLPALSQVSGWIDSAKKLPRVVEY
jgi:predicted flap endonuclease-1-like 5' DNA nuclease